MFQRKSPQTLFHLCTAAVQALTASTSVFLLKLVSCPPNMFLFAAISVADSEELIGSRWPLDSVQPHLTAFIWTPEPL